MNVTAEALEALVSIKIDKFSGQKKDWEDWYETFKTMLQRKGMGAVIAHLDDDMEVPADSDDCIGLDGQVDTVRLKFKKENKQAYAYLVSHMDQKTRAGKICYKRVLNHRRDPHSEGNFETIMPEFRKLCAQDKPDDKVDLQTTLHTSKLGTQQDPVEFMSEMTETRRKLEENFGVVTSDYELISLIVNKLPWFEDRTKIPPYNDIKKEYIALLEDETNFDKTVFDLEKDLNDRFEELYPHLRNGGEVGLIGGQVKSRCFRCGSWDHKSFNCPDLTSNKPMFDPGAFARVMSNQSNANNSNGSGRGNGGRGRSRPTRLSRS